MTKKFVVNIEFNPRNEKMLIIPNEIRVPIESVIQWNIIGLDKFSFERTLWRKGLNFTLYFNDGTPFPWEKQSVKINDNAHLKPNSKFRLAKEVAERRGEFKYGVKITEALNNTTLYDEDPIIKIF